MNKLREVIDQVTSSDVPGWVLGGTGIILFVLALKMVKGSLRFIFIVLALAALAGAAWWHFHNQGKI